jgi:hypothetical protein
MRLESISRNINRNIFNQSIPGNSNSPNTIVDFIGTNNRLWSLKGWLPLRSGLGIPEGLGTFSPGNTELDISGLSMLEVTGSPLFFTDEVMTINRPVVDGVLAGSYIKTVQVQIINITSERNNDYSSSNYEVGYVLPYSISLVETK